MQHLRFEHDKFAEYIETPFKDRLEDKMVASERSKEYKIYVNKYKKIKRRLSEYNWDLRSTKIGDNYSLLIKQSIL